MSAIATFSAQHNPTYDRDIVVSANLRAAIGARRARFDDGKIAWNAINHHVKEATEH